MKYSYLIVIVILFSSCLNNNESNTYYESGSIKIRKIYENKKDTLNYILENYYPNGQIFQKGQIKDGLTEGMVYQYSEKGQLKIETLYIKGLKNGTQLTFDQNNNIEAKNYFEDDTVFLIYKYLKDESINIYTLYENEPILIGALEYDNAKLEKEKSYYYNVNSSDTLKLENEENVEVEIFYLQKPYKSVEILLTDRFEMFESVNEKIITSDKLNLNFTIKPINKGYAILTGVISLKDEDNNTIKQFYLHKQFYIE